MGVEYDRSAASDLSSRHTFHLHPLMELDTREVLDAALPIAVPRIEREHGFLFARRVTDDNKHDTPRLVELNRTDAQLAAIRPGG